MNVELMTKYYLEFLSLKVVCTDSYESTLVKMPHCWKSRVTAQGKMWTSALAPCHCSFVNILQVSFLRARIQKVLSEGVQL